MIIRFAGFGGQGIVLILRVIACYDRKITRPIEDGYGKSQIPRSGAVTRCLEEAGA